jgi:hypothetical protein
MGLIDAAWAADVEDSRRRLARCHPWYADLDTPRQLALAAMHAELGPADADDLRRVIACLATGEPHQASAAMLLSAWAKRAGQRAWRIAQVMRTGEAEPKAAN